MCRQSVVKLSSNLSAFYSAARDRAGPIMFGDSFRGFARPLRLAGFSYYLLPENDVNSLVENISNRLVNSLFSSSVR